VFTLFVQHHRQRQLGKKFAEEELAAKQKEHGKKHASAAAEIVDEAADAALGGKDKKKKDHHHRDEKNDKKQSPVDQMSHNAHVKEHEWQPLADKLFTCRMAPAVCSPDILKRLQLALLAAAKMHEDIWFIGGWALSMIGFVIFGLGVWISKVVDGDDSVLNGASGGGSAGKEGTAVDQDYQPVNVQSIEDDEDGSEHVGGGGDIESPSKQGNGIIRNHAIIPQSGIERFTAKFALFWNRRIARKESGAAAIQRRPKRSKSSVAVGSSTTTSSEHFDENEMTFLPEMTSSEDKDGQARHSTVGSNGYDDEDDEDDPSPSKLKRTPYHLEVGPNATSIKAIIQRIPDNIMTYWTNTSLIFVRPLLSFKCFVAFLLFIELNEIMAPEQSMLATPEVVSLIRAYPRKHEYVNPYVRWIMPGLISEDVDGGTSVDAWVWKLEILRFVLLISWYFFLLLPKKFPMTNGMCYAIGAIIYVYLGVIGLMYDLAHSTQGGMLFILSAIPAIPFLETSRRANHWLRKFLYVGVFVPLYLFSGISKFRYLGIIPNLTGSWLWGDFGKGKLHRAVWKSLFSFIGDHHWVMFIFSWGNIVLEIILPMLLMLFNEIRLVQWAFHFVAIMFHVTIFLLLGPNFMRYCLMHLYAVDIPAYFSCFSTSDRPVAVSRPIKMDWGRIVYSIIILFAWWYVQFNSDVMHLTGQQSWKTRINSYWPIPELSMFAKPKDSANIYIAFIFSVLSFFTLAIDMVR